MEGRRRRRRKFDEDEDFYMVLPSNASPNTHPNNSASDFIISWEDSFELNPLDMWSVALTEINFQIQAPSFSENHSIRYQKYICEERLIESPVIVKRYSAKVRLADSNEIKEIAADYRVHSPQFADLESTMYFNIKIYECDGRLTITSALYPFCIGENTPLNALDLFGFEIGQFGERSGYRKAYTLQGSENVITKIDKIWNGQETTISLGESLCLKFFIYEPKEYIFSFPDGIILDNTFQLVDYLRKKCNHIFRSIRIERQKIKLTLAKHVFNINFYGGVNLLLGFSKLYFTSKYLEEMMHPHYNHFHESILADFAPFDLSTQNMYIYASICKPIYVGHTLVPLLKNVFVKSKSYVRNHVVRHPMYIPVKPISFNHVEINIRNDNGELINFPIGTKLCLTLHFKKKKNSL